MRLVKGSARGRSAAGSSLRATQRAFTSMADVAQRAELSPRATRALAMCGAFRSLTEHRNLAFWEALGVERCAESLAGDRCDEELPALPAPSEWEEILRDYHQLGLSTGRHPLALLRPRLRSLGVLRRRDLESIGSGSRVCVSGLVTHLQHPQTANGVDLRFAGGRNRHQQHHLLAGRVRGRATQHPGTTLMIVYRRAAERARRDSRRRPARRRLLALGASDCPAIRGTFIEPGR